MIIGTVTPPATMEAGDLFVIVAAYRGNTTLSLASTGGQTRASEANMHRRLGRRRGVLPARGEAGAGLGRHQAIVASQQ